MGDDFDSRNRFLKIRANGSYEGCIIGGTGEAWGISAKKVSTQVSISIRFRMGGYVMAIQDDLDIAAVDPTGTTTYVSSE